MTYRYITVDGMLSGTGIRDSVAGGYIALKDLGLSKSLIRRIEQWLSKYENEHYSGFSDSAQCESLDREGIAICRELQRELASAKVEYYSHAQSIKIPLPFDSSPP